MSQAVVLANGLIVKKDFFNGNLALFNSNGTVRDFVLNGKFYSDFYSDGKKFLFYGDQSWWLDFVKKNKKEPLQPQFKGSYLPNEIFENYKAVQGDTVTLSTRIIKVNGSGGKSICYKKYEWNFTGQIFLPDKPIVPPSGSEKEDDCSGDDTYNVFFNLNAGRPAIGPDGNSEVINQDLVADIAQMLGEFSSSDKPFYSLLSAEGLLPVMQKQKEYMSSSMQQDLSDYYDKKWEYSVYNNDAYIKYRNFLLQYRAYYNANKALIDTYSEPEKMLFLANMFNSAELSALPIGKKIKMIEVTARGALIGDWLFNTATEPLAVKMINAISYRDINGNLNYAEIDLFMDKLQGQFNGSSKSLFQTLYDKIQDPVFFGDDGKGNKGQFVNAVYKLWLVSKYNPYKEDDENVISTDVTYNYNNDTAPISIDYRSDSFLGIKFDSFDFKFDEDPQSKYNKHIISREKETTTHAPVSSGDPGISTSYSERGRYHMFQPVYLTERLSESLVNMPYISGGTGDKRSNNFIPVFYLKYKGDVDGISNIKQVSNLILDIALTFTGVGNIGKLRYLRFFRVLEWGLPEFKIVLGAVQFTSGLLNLMATYVGNNCESEFCKKLKSILFWMEIATGALDAVTEVMIKKAARNLKDVTAASGLPEDFLENAAQRTDFQNKIDQLAADAATGAVTIFDRLKAEVLIKMERANLDKFGKRKIQDLYTLIHSEEELKSIVDKGISVGLSEAEIQGFIFVSGREDKPIIASVLKEQMDYWVSVKAQGYPFGKFVSMADFEVFKSKVITLVKEFDLPISDIRVQGSALRTASAKDVDLAIFVTEEQVAELKAKLLNRLKLEYVDESGELTKKGEANFKKMAKRLEDQMSKGFIKNRQFGKKDGSTFMETLYDRHILPTSELDISIIIKKQGFDTPPYLNF